jgi:class 3 adenylate cyclase
LSRLGPFDKAMVLILVPLWAVCFGLALKTQLDFHGFAPVELSVEDRESYPTLTGEFLGFMYQGVDPLAEAGLRARDRLVRVGEFDLRGMGFIRFNERVLTVAGRRSHVPVEFERDGVREEALLPLAPFSQIRSNLFSAVVALASGLFLLLRGRPTPMVRAYFYATVAAAFFRSQFPAPGPQLYAWIGVCWISGAFMAPLGIHFVLRFPDDRVPPSPWHRFWPSLFAVLGLFITFQFLGPMRIGVLGFLVTILLSLVTRLGVATWKYLRTDPVGRRQMKWILLGLYGSSLPFVVSTALTLFDAQFSWLWWASFFGTAILPLSIVVSVVRFNVFDIDRILSATASYNVLAVTLAAAALIAVPRLAEAASTLLGVDPGAGQVVLSLALAALVIPAHRRLRPQIDRIFFKERYGLDRGIAELLPELSRCRDTRELIERVGGSLHALLRPDACVVYALGEGGYASVFAEGRAVPPAFAPSSPLVGTLIERGAPLSLSAAGRRPDEAPLGPFDRAALETLDAEVVVPVRRGETLAAFVCLGPRRSGDVYTTTDLSLLTMVAEVVSQRLQRFDQEETIRVGREMQESLRRYVPGAVAEQLATGAELASGEREVSVLFVDIRGYTSFAESRRAEEIFSTVNRYTETVSQIVQEHAGSVVEFNGDGMMAVFGAPRQLAHKELAAVEAGRRIVEAVGALPVEGAEPLVVGVGIATGSAFVGNIQAVDRMIWSAIGNTTNLAARLQSLTRELNASVVIDSATWERALSAASDFEKKPAVEIRGRRDTQDVYALPLPAAPTTRMQ